MKIQLKICVVAILICQFAPIFSQKNLIEIKNFEQARYAALVKKDLPTLEKMLADELVYTHSNTTVEDKRAYLAALETGKYTFRQFETDSTEYHFYGKKLVVAAGVARMHGFLFEREFRLRARFTAVYVRQHRRWKLAAWQTTRFPN